MKIENLPYAALIPMPVIAAILFMVAYNMCDIKTFVNLCKTSPKSDIIVLVSTFVLTVVFDLVVAIEVGILLAAILFMKRMSDVTEVEGWKYVDEDDDADSLALRVVPDHITVYEISGPLFFGAADKILKITLDEKRRCLPSHATGAYRYVPPMAKAAVACGADGLMIEVHNNPACALSDGPQSLNFEKFARLSKELDPFWKLAGRN